jgi:hypothetical protein
MKMCGEFKNSNHYSNMPPKSKKNKDDVTPSEVDDETLEGRVVKLSEKLKTVENELIAIKNLAVKDYFDNLKRPDFNSVLDKLEDMCSLRKNASEDPNALAFVMKTTSPRLYIDYWYVSFVAVHN